jgi:hypothetical protein
MSLSLTDLSEGDIVLIVAFDDIPEHPFRVDTVFEDCVGGVSLSGPLKDEYGEPDLSMILRIVAKAGDQGRA